jgi:hypothetical protein
LEIVVARQPIPIFALLEGVFVVGQRYLFLLLHILIQVFHHSNHHLAAILLDLDNRFQGEIYQRVNLKLWLVGNLRDTQANGLV